LAERPRSGRLRRGIRPRAVLSAVTIGAVGAGIGVVSSAQAAPDYPSWDDVQNAKRDEASKQAEIESLTGLLAGLQESADAASKASRIADEKYRIAKDALDEATARADALATQAATAEQKAAVSRMRAGLLAAHLARGAGGDVGLDLALGGDADDLLGQLSSMGKLTEQTQKIYSTALADKNQAASLGEQAKAAKAALQRRADEAEKRRGAADDAAARTRSALADQESRQGELFAQLATLKDTTAAEETAYQAGLEEQRQAAARPVVVTPLPPASPPAESTGSDSAPNSGSSGDSGGASNSGGGSSDSGSGSSNSGGGSSDSGSGSSGGGGAPAQGPPDVGAPSADAVAIAIAFAREQLGDRYDLGGSGPDVWDCSGLTKAAYAAAGISIGTHSATNQYNTAARNGQLLPYSDRRAGDLLFWTDGDGDMYHVALYTGGGMMVEAPDYGVPVRERSVWNNGDLVGWVARPSA